MGGTSKSSILMGVSMINQPFWGSPVYGNPHIYKEPGKDSKTRFH